MLSLLEALLDILTFPWPGDGRIGRAERLGCVIGLAGGLAVGLIAAIATLGGN